MILYTDISSQKLKHTLQYYKTTWGETETETKKKKRNYFPIAKISGYAIVFAFEIIKIKILLSIPLPWSNPDQPPNLTKLILRNPRRKIENKNTFNARKIEFVYV